MICGKARCGMYYAVKRGGSAVGYCSLSVRCGTRDEAGYNEGIAHFTEHTLFKGTSKKKASVINNYLDRLGGELNAYTTKEEIVLHATVLKEDLKKACSLILELVTSPAFPEKEVETERGVILDEIKSYKDSPSDEVYDRFEEKLFKGHPLSKSILGTVDSVKKITSQELHCFVKEKFLPQSMAFTVVADIDEAVIERRVLKLIESFFPSADYGEDIPANISGRVIKPLPLSPGRFDIIENKKNNEVNIVAGSIAPSLYEEKDRIAAVLLGNILAGPSSNSVLNNILREKKGWVYAVEASYTQYSDTGVFAICLGCDKSNIDNCTAAIHKETLKLQTIPLSDSKLKAAKKQLLGQLSINSDNGEAQCLSMGKSLIAYGRVASDAEIRTKIEELSSEDILRVARRIFGGHNICRLVFL